MLTDVTRSSEQITVGAVRAAWPSAWLSGHLGVPPWFLSFKLEALCFSSMHKYTCILLNVRVLLIKHLESLRCAPDVSGDAKVSQFQRGTCRILARGSCGALQVLYKFFASVLQVFYKFVTSVIQVFCECFASVLHVFLCLYTPHST